MPRKNNLQEKGMVKSEAHPSSASNFRNKQCSMMLPQVPLKKFRSAAVFKILVLYRRSTILMKQTSLSNYKK
jgi:hypothetical protein